MRDTLRKKLDELPDKPGCYLYRDRAGKIIYIGKAVSLRKRVQSYFRASTLRSAAPKLRSLINSVADIDHIVVRNEAEALLTEGNLIKQYKPRYNILLRDDKRYLALRADPREPYPRLTTCRIVREDGAIYFGPFPSSPIVRATLDFVEKKYGLRKCRAITPGPEDHAHCINDIVRFCSAPCVGRVTQGEYRERFEEACAFLRGERLAVIEEVKGEMAEAAARHDFEKAALLRDTWIALREMIKKRARVLTTPAMRAEAAAGGAAELGKLLGVAAPLGLIECFYISNLFGSWSVASMVAAVGGLPDRRLYRRFRIRSVEGADDPRSMGEVIERRYQRLIQDGGQLPDLVVVDGGVTQLRAARARLATLGLGGVTVIGLAERQEEIVRDNGLPSLLLERDSAALQVLTRLRDEAHRFALDYHRRLRQRIIRESSLDEIEGIGPAKKAALLKHFGSVYRLARADVAAIASVPGIGMERAEAIRRALG